MVETISPRVGLVRYSADADSPSRADWETTMAALEDKTAVDLQGTFAARPAAGTRGRYYWATDRDVLYRDTGTAWKAVGPGEGPAAFVYRTTNLVVPGGGATSTFVPFTNAEYDDGPMFNNGQPARLTPPFAGIYMLSASVEFPAFAGAGTCNAAIFKNGVLAIPQGAAGETATVNYRNPSGDYGANAGDYFEVGLYQGSGFAQTLVSRPHSIHFKARWCRPLP